MLQNGFHFGEWEMHHRQQALLSEAQEARRANGSHFSGSPLRSGATLAVARLGQWLVAWGTRLQERSTAALQTGTSSGAARA